MYDKQKRGPLNKKQCRRSGRGWKTPLGTSRIYFASCVFLSNERPPESSLINNPPLDVMKRVYEKTQSAQN